MGDWYEADRLCINCGHVVYAHPQESRPTSPGAQLPGRTKPKQTIEAGPSANSASAPAA